MPYARHVCGYSVREDTCVPIKLLTPQSETDASLYKWVANCCRVLIRRLSAIGEQVVNKARSNPSPPQSQARLPHQPNYIDWTANLRSSIGYVIVENGNIVSIGGFNPEKGGSEGAQKGRAYAESLAHEYSTGIALVVVAGENYATWVASRGYDVIDGAQLLAEKLVPQMLRELGFKF